MSKNSKIDPLKFPCLEKLLEMNPRVCMSCDEYFTVTKKKDHNQIICDACRAKSDTWAYNCHVKGQAE